MAYEHARLDRENRKLLSKEEVSKWWAEAQKEGEEAYVLRMAVKHHPNEHLLGVIEKKYPKRLPDVFTALKKEDPYWCSLDPFVDVLCRSSLPAANKKKLLLEAVETNEEWWQAAALKGLHGIDADDFHKQLIAVLGDLPTWKDKKKADDLLPACHTCITRVATLTDDAKVWASVGKYLDGATPEVKLEWISHLRDSVEKEDQSYARVVACLTALMADKTFRVDKSGDLVRLVHVRNSAAESLGEMLRVRGTPRDDAHPDDWEAYRDKVAKAAKDAVKAKK